MKVALELITMLSTFPQPHALSLLYLCYLYTGLPECTLISREQGMGLVLKSILSKCLYCQSQGCALQRIGSQKMYLNQRMYLLAWTS